MRVPAGAFAPLYDAVDFERKIRAQGWFRFPVVGVRDDRIHYEFRFDGMSEAHEAPRLLHDFLELEHGTDSDIEAYARRWGVLGLCEHNLPMSHPNLQMFLAVHWSILKSAAPRKRKVENWFEEPLAIAGALESVETCKGVPYPGTRCSESLKAWRWYASVARRLLEEGSALREASGSRSNGRLRLRELAARLDGWLRLAPMRLVCEGEGRGLRLKLNAVEWFAGLSAVLAAQVCFVASGSKSALQCSECGRLYFPKRKPTRGSRRYCSRCGIRAAWRAASRDHYRIKKEAKSG